MNTYTYTKKWFGKIHQCTSVIHSESDKKLLDDGIDFIYDLIDDIYIRKLINKNYEEPMLIIKNGDSKTNPNWDRSKYLS